MIIYALGIGTGICISAAGQYFFPGVTAKVYGWLGSLIAAAAGAMHLGGGTP